MPPQLETPILTAEDYLHLPNDGKSTELVRGRIIEMNRPFTAHGYFCFRVAMLLGRFIEQFDLGRIVTNDAGMITQRNPDTVRGPDVAFYSYDRIPRGELPKGYWPSSPELVIEIKSPDDRWKDLLQKTAEFLNANVSTVAILDPESRRVHVFSPDRESSIFGSNDILVFDDVLPGFSVAVNQLFE